MIYATLLPTGLVKVGRATRIGRAYFAQMYFLEDVRVLAVWVVDDDKVAEYRAMAACRPFHVRGELHRGNPDDIRLAITSVLGEPHLTDLPKYGRGRPRSGETRVAAPIPAEVREQARRATTLHTLRQICDLV